MFAHLKTHDLLSFKVVARGADEGCDCSGCRTDDTRGKAAERQLLRRDHHLVDVWSCRGHLMMRARLGPRGSAPSFVGRATLGVSPVTARERYVSAIHRAGRSLCLPRAHDVIASARARHPRSDFQSFTGVATRVHAPQGALPIHPHTELELATQ